MKRVLFFVVSAGGCLILAGCGTFAEPTPTPPPELSYVRAIETRVQAACDDFIRKQASLTVEGVYDLDTNSSEDLPDFVLAASVEQAYSDALSLFDGMHANAPHSSAVRVLIGRIAPMDRHVSGWEEAFTVEFANLLLEHFPEADVTQTPGQASISEWRSQAVELCANW